MATIYDATDVFTPTEVPTVTYVYRQDKDLESQLKLAVKTPGLIVSLSGPSKSGKTVLMKRVIPSDDLITVSGASIKTPDQLWDRVLNWMDAPIETSTKSAATATLEGGGKAGGKVKLPLVGEGGAEANAKAGLAGTSEVSSKFGRHGIDQVVREIGGSSFTIFIDDYHYMAKETQQEVARQIKEAAEKGVRICTASVPHRADDVVRGNPELRGRVKAIDFEYWQLSEVVQIAEAGFPALGITLSRGVIEALAKEAFGSPQLMQSMCLQACYQLAVERTVTPPREFDLNEDRLKRVLQHTATTTDFSSLLDALHAGPKLRGQERRQFTFKDGTTGDVYRCVLLALASDPPALSFTYDNIYDRTRDICVSEAPVGSAVSGSLAQMHEIAENIQPLSRVIEWSEDVLDIADPYFLYYLRCSNRLSKLQSA